MLARAFEERVALDPLELGFPAVRTPEPQDVLVVVIEKHRLPAGGIRGEPDAQAFLTHGCERDSQYLARKIRRNPMEFVPRTRRPDAEALNLVTVSSQEVAAMFNAAETWPERLCVAILAYLGPRRHAAAMLTLRDYDQLRGRLRFHEKGSKIIAKPIPTALRDLINAAIAAGAILDAPDDYLIPPEGPTVRHPRDDRCVWRLVRKIGARAEVEAHTHSLRAAFADFYLDSGGDAKAPQLLMGHTNPATTERYTRRYDREKRMEQVRSLSWQRLTDRNPQIAEGELGESLGVGAGGFEPP